MNRHATQQGAHQGAQQITRPSSAGSAWLIAKREISTRLRSKAFLISTGILLLIVLGGVLFGGFVSSTGGFGGPPTVAAPAAMAGELSEAGFEVTEAGTESEVHALVTDGTVDAGVVVSGGDDAGVTVIALESAPSELVQALSTAPEVELLDPITTNIGLAYLVSFAFAMVFFVSVMTFGTTTAQSVVEEKQTRIVEILLATVSARVLLAGKIIGMSILAIAQVVAIVVLASVGMLLTGQELLFGDLGVSLAWFGVLFTFGFVLIATLYAALASLVSRQEDIGSATSPVMVLVMIPFYLVIFFFSNAEVLGWLSYFPLSSPIAMPLRLYMGVAEWWEPLASFGVLLATIALVLWFGARIYSNSILRTGTRVSLKDALARTE